ncbi:protein kinase domain-containing protein [Cerasicoccus frondis]|uniref:protein kinase domain-containing protein n=1 Tax=Cerasicoccus frondis TaxID=490090 RepID=UPI00285263D6|nr:protein kinase [Cerasicoccus frondis]
MQSSDSTPEPSRQPNPSPADLLAAGLSSNPQPNDVHSSPAPSPEDLAAEFPKLEILELLGRGGMGAVYKARQKDLDRIVALKILRPGLDADPGFAERFSREARTLAKLNHSGIVTLYEFGQTSAGRYFILMEFVDGVNLRHLLNAGRLAPREALTIVPPLCDALQYAHDHGVVHRDIKPENILVDRLGRVKIADFGLVRLAKGDADLPAAEATAEDGLTFTGEVMGTPAYMAPEQNERPGQVDHRADLYALGVVFYQMLTGELPREGELQPPSQRVSLDVRLDAIVLRALERDPARRYFAASEFKTQLASLSEAPPAQPPSTRYGLWRDLNYRTRASIFGLPLVHVATGVDPQTGRKRIARGVIAVGEVAQGVVALGGLAMGVFAFGGVALGVFGYGGLVIALLAMGGLGIGLLGAYAGLAIAPLALGGLAIGWYASGGQGIGRHVLDARHQDAAAVELFQQFPAGFTNQLNAVLIGVMVVGFATMSFFHAWAAYRQGRKVTADSLGLRGDGQRLPLGLASLLIFLITMYCGFLMFGAREFPASVAVHFDWNGQPDSWASRGVAMLTMLVVGVGIPYFIVTVFALVRFLPDYLINMPHAGFWLAAERREQTHQSLVRYGLVVACLVTALFCALQLLGQIANDMDPVRMPMRALWMVVGAFLLCLSVWIVRFWRRFSLQTTRFDQPPAQSNFARWMRPAAPWLFVFLIAAAVLLPIETAITILEANRNEPPGKSAMWNLDVVVTDQTSWPPETLNEPNALNVAGATLALLGSCSVREPGLVEDWQVATAGPHLRLEYPRADASNMPNVIVVTFPLSTGSVWTRKGAAITRHTKYSPVRVEELKTVLAQAGKGEAQTQFDWNARLDPLIDDTDFTILDLVSGQAMPLTAPTVEEASLPPFALLYNRVSDTDGLTGEVIETREFLVAKAADLRLLALTEAEAQNASESQLRAELRATPPAEREALLAFQPVSFASDAWLGFEVVASDGGRLLGILHVVPEDSGLRIEARLFNSPSIR